MQYDVFSSKKFAYENFLKILSFFKNLGLDPDPDWIRIQQQTGSKSKFYKNTWMRIQ